MQNPQVGEWLKMMMRKMMIQMLLKGMNEVRSARKTSDEPGFPSYQQGSHQATNIYFVVEEGKDDKDREW